MVGEAECERGVDALEDAEPGMELSLELRVEKVLFSDTGREEYSGRDTDRMATRLNR